MKTKWKMILVVSWTLTMLALLCTFESCRSGRYENEQYRGLAGECQMQQGEIRQMFCAVIKELDGLPEQKRVRIFALLKDQDGKIQEFRQRHYWSGGEEGITDLIKAGKMADPTTGRTVPPKAGASGVQ